MLENILKSQRQLVVNPTHFYLMTAVQHDVEVFAAACGDYILAASTAYDVLPSTPSGRAKIAALKCESQRRWWCVRAWLV